MPQPRLQTVFGAPSNGDDRVTRFHRLLYGAADTSEGKIGLAITTDTNVLEFVEHNQPFMEKTIMNQIFDEVGSDVKKMAAHLVVAQLESTTEKISIPDAVRVASNVLLLQSIGVTTEHTAEAHIAYANETGDLTHHVDAAIAKNYKEQSSNTKFATKAVSIIEKQLRNSLGHKGGGDTRRTQKLYSAFDAVFKDATMLVQVKSLFQGSTYEADADAIENVDGLTEFAHAHGAGITDFVKEKIAAMAEDKDLPKVASDGIAKYIVKNLQNGTYVSMETAVDNAHSFMKSTTDLSSLENAVHSASEKIAALIRTLAERTRELDDLRNKPGEPTVPAIAGLESRLAETSGKLASTTKELMSITNETAAEASLLIHLLAVMTTTLDGVSKVGIERDGEMKTKIDALIESLTEAEKGVPGDVV